jgi:hypothetical protein
LAEQLICNQQVAGSSPIAGFGALALVKIPNKSWGLFSRVVAQAGWKWPKMA